MDENVEKFSAMVKCRSYDFIFVNNACKVVTIISYRILVLYVLWSSKKDNLKIHDIQEIWDETMEIFSSIGLECFKSSSILGLL